MFSMYNILRNETDINIKIKTIKRGCGQNAVFKRGMRIFFWTFLIL